MDKKRKNQVKYVLPALLGSLGCLLLFYSRVEWCFPLLYLWLAGSGAVFCASKGGARRLSAGGFLLGGMVAIRYACTRYSLYQVQSAVGIAAYPAEAVVHWAWYSVGTLLCMALLWTVPVWYKSQKESKGRRD